MGLLSETCMYSVHLCYAVILYTLFELYCNFCRWKIQGINEPIEEDKSPEEIRYEPYSLPSGFILDTLDLLDPLIVRHTFSLHLKKHTHWTHLIPS